LAKTTIALAEKGLARRRRLDAGGEDERRYLRPIEEYVARGVTPAEELLEKFHGGWGRRVELVFTVYAYLGHETPICGSGLFAMAVCSLAAPGQPGHAG